MDFSGIIVPFLIKRPLTDQEKAHQLHQKRRLAVAPRDQLSVIAMNSTYLESVDKWFGWKGTVSLITVALMLIFTHSVGQMAATWLLQAAGIKQTTLATGVLLANGLAALVVYGLILWGCITFLRRESFAYTHYPLRFNRKNRTVYVWRTNGTVLEVPWDDVFFTLAKVVEQWEVRGHVLAPDKLTIVESFALSHSDLMSHEDLDPASRRYSDRDTVRAHWEFIRRYMEDGPEEASRQILFCMPVDGRRETAKGGMHRVFVNFNGAPWPFLLMLSPILLLVSLFRILAMRTSKIPQWPDHVEAACAVEAGDPYAIAGDAAGDRIAVYPEAAEAASVRLTSVTGSKA
ncbi:DUF6708 domain-containing protein [Pseudoduganella buxea]|uniref:DUF6708 domain-containing protein n=1 Tax=Pseudoduganella buxea TaxID=1949069 RepID=A0A6I3STD7_9BURK|nr:DUF6708 domain-containing protein [Pseudoduganella buxea]MTV52408.1 hypothetical protein [Pseudoduganella buxea]GGC17966.1 hypothetical protein GCM10011572_44130 [Pseudoduganella buxea]